MAKRRGEFVRELKAHWTVKVLLGIWVLLGAISTTVTYGPPSWQQAVSAAQYFPKVPWYVWVIGILVLGMVVLFEAAYKAYAGIRPADSGEAGDTRNTGSRAEVKNSGNATLTQNFWPPFGTQQTRELPPEPEPQLAFLHGENLDATESHDLISRWVRANAGPHHGVIAVFENTGGECKVEARLRI